jgi:hypothetical protein
MKRTLKDALLKNPELVDKESASIATKILNHRSFQKAKSISIFITKTGKNVPGIQKKTFNKYSCMLF